MGEREKINACTSQACRAYSESSLRLATAQRFILETGIYGAGAGGRGTQPLIREGNLAPYLHDYK